MNSKIDVLAVMERAAREAVPLAFALDVDNARAALAELIEAAGDLLDRHDGRKAYLGHRQAQHRLRAALARVTGA